MRCATLGWIFLDRVWALPPVNRLARLTHCFSRRLDLPVRWIDACVHVFFAGFLSRGQWAISRVIRSRSAWKQLLWFSPAIKCVPQRLDIWKSINHTQTLWCQKSQPSPWYSCDLKWFLMNLDPTGNALPLLIPHCGLNLIFMHL